MCRKHKQPTKTDIAKECLTQFFLGELKKKMPNYAFGESSNEVALRLQFNCDHIFTKIIDNGCTLGKFICRGMKQKGDCFIDCRRVFQASEIFYGCVDCEAYLCMECLPPISCFNNRCIKYGNDMLHLTQTDVICQMCSNIGVALQCSQNNQGLHPKFTICTCYVSNLLFFFFFLFLQQIQIHTQRRAKHKIAQPFFIFGHSLCRLHRRCKKRSRFPSLKSV